MTGTPLDHTPAGGAQRLTLEKLHAWESLGYGMFIHFGLSTFVGQELPSGNEPSGVYAPDRLDVDQWIRCARDAGMRYAVLTTKHVSGHCLWPSRHTDYHVGTSGNSTDVVGEFVAACAKYAIVPGFYYCSWDNHHRLGSVTWSDAPYEKTFTTRAYRDFQLAQIEELLTRYGPVGELWVDIPGVLGHDGRREQYAQIARLAPEALVMMNHGISSGSGPLLMDKAWPTDLMAIERFLPSSNRGYEPWFRIAQTTEDVRDFYIPGEVCDPIGYEWFWDEGDTLRSGAELLGMRLICRERGVNLLLDVPPDRHGVIPPRTVEALARLRRAMESLAG
jgi:alpha-L-fucosidase